MYRIFIILSCLSASFACQQRSSANTNDVMAMHIENRAQNPELKASMERGSELYSDLCITCHLPAGEGVEGIYPPLAKSDFLVKEPIKSIKAVKYGMKGEILVNGTIYNNVMTNPGLTNKEVADVMNFVNHSWGNSIDSLITEEEVSEIEP